MSRHSACKEYSKDGKTDKDAGRLHFETLQQKQCTTLKGHKDVQPDCKRTSSRRCHTWMQSEVDLLEKCPCPSSGLKISHKRLPKVLKPQLTREPRAVGQMISEMSKNRSLAIVPARLTFEGGLSWSVLVSGAAHSGCRLTRLTPSLLHILERCERPVWFLDILLITWPTARGVL